MKRMERRHVDTVVVEVGVRDGDPVGGVGDVKETIVMVFVVVQVGGEVPTKRVNMGRKNTAFLMKSYM